ncbi:hypothetical protein D3C87_1333320 [compost metagenome]
MTGLDVLLDLFAKMDPIQLGHHYITNDQVYLHFFQQFQCFPAVKSNINLIAAAEITAQVSNNFAVIIYNK